MAEAITYAVRDGLAEITFDDGKVNAMSLPFFDGLNGALDRAERERPGAVIVTGRPGVFSAGLNLKVLPTLPPAELHKTLVAFGQTMLRVFTFPIPTVAAVTGHAIAGGAMLMFACDLRLVAEGPHRLQLNETAIGLTLPTWAIVIAESAIPLRWRTEAILHARLYSPEDAHERALVHAVVRPSGRLLDEARTAAAPLAALDQPAYGASKARQRAMVVRWASDLIEPEAARLPAKATIS